MQLDDETRRRVAAALRPGETLPRELLTHRNAEPALCEWLLMREAGQRMRQLPSWSTAREREAHQARHHRARMCELLGIDPTPWFEARDAWHGEQERIAWEEQPNPWDSPFAPPSDGDGDD